jgi:glycosyltransferase involved in cell wall biosynthesis
VHSHVHHFSGVVLHAADRAGALVRLAHSHTTSDGRASQPGRSAYRWLMRRLIRRHATGLIGCSRAACEALFGPACWRDPRVAVLPNAIDLDRYSRLDESRCALREQLGLPADATLIAHVGSFSPVKNHRMLIETFAALVKQLPAAHLMLAGDGPLRPAIEAHIRACGVEPFVYMLGVRDDVPRLLAASDLFLFPSLYEGLGIAVIEAQAAGIPCVVADTVPAEADMRLGLMRFVSVQAEPDRWVDQALAALDTRRPVWIERQRALQTAGYDIRVITRRLEQLYVGRQTQYEGTYDHHNSVASHY